MRVVGLGMGIVHGCRREANMGPVEEESAVVQSLVLMDVEDGRADEGGRW